jgi:hypothetical protein
MAMREIKHIVKSHGMYDEMDKAINQAFSEHWVLVNVYENEGVNGGSHIVAWLVK